MFAPKTSAPTTGGLSLTTNSLLLVLPLIFVCEIHLSDLLPTLALICSIVASHSPCYIVACGLSEALLVSRRKKS